MGLGQQHHGAGRKVGLLGLEQGARQIGHMARVGRVAYVHGLVQGLGVAHHTHRQWQPLLGRGRILACIAAEGALGLARQDGRRGHAGLGRHEGV